MVFGDDKSFASRFVSCSAYEFHLATGEGKAVQIEDGFFTNLNVGKTLLPERVQHQWRNLISTDRSHHGSRECVNELPCVMRRAHRVACDQSDPAANLVGEKSINAWRREIGFRSLEQHVRARACAVSPDPRIEFRLLHLHESWAFNNSSGSSSNACDVCDDGDDGASNSYRDGPWRWLWLTANLRSPPRTAPRHRAQ